MKTTQKKVAGRKNQFEALAEKPTTLSKIQQVLDLDFPRVVFFKRTANFVAPNSSEKIERTEYGVRMYYNEIGNIAQIESCEDYLEGVGMDIEHAARKLQEKIDFEKLRLAQGFLKMKDLSI